jgi:hypothetical protein
MPPAPIDVFDYACEAFHFAVALANIFEYVDGVRGNARDKTLWPYAETRTWYGVIWTLF